MAPSTNAILPARAAFSVTNVIETPFGKAKGIPLLGALASKVGGSLTRPLPELEFRKFQLTLWDPPRGGPDLLGGVYCRRTGMSSGCWRQSRLFGATERWPLVAMRPVTFGAATVRERSSRTLLCVLCSGGGIRGEAFAASSGRQTKVNQLDVYRGKRQGRGYHFGVIGRGPVCLHDTALGMAVDAL
jgi:hypothetical protein